MLSAGVRLRSGVTTADSIIVRIKEERDGGAVLAAAPVTYLF
jgi:hypothetical protein